VDARPLLDAALAAFGLPAIVTPPDSSPVETTAFWLPPTAAEEPAGKVSSFQRTERHRLLVLDLRDVPEIPRGTVIEVAEYDGGDVLAWEVDSTVEADVDHHRVLVVPIEES
jgi:hypothetical protein